MARVVVCGVGCLSWDQQGRRLGRCRGPVWIVLLEESRRGRVALLKVVR